MSYAAHEQQDTHLGWFLRDRLAWLQAQIHVMNLRHETPIGISVPPRFLEADHTQPSAFFLGLPVHRHDLNSSDGLEDELRIFSEHSVASLATLNK